MSDNVPEILQVVQRTKPTTLLHLLAGFLVGAVAMLGSLMLIGAVGDSSSESTTGTSHDPGGGMSDGPMTTSGSSPGSSKATGDEKGMGVLTLEGALREHIPENIAPKCHGGDHRNVEEIAYFSVTCPLGGEPVIEVQYSSFHDAEAMRTWYANDAHAHGIDLASAVTCTAQVLEGCASGYWMAPSGAMAKHAIRHHTTGTRLPSSTSGRMMSYWDGQEAVIEWFDSDTHIYAWATSSRDAAPQLLKWWTEIAGPAHPRM